MQLSLSLRLPRDARTVTIARLVLEQALTTLGVRAECRDDIALILAEACNNAIDHAEQGSEYDVGVQVVNGSCQIEVSDNGRIELLPVITDGIEDPYAESGRGLRIIATLADTVHLRLRRPHGLVLRATKALTWQPGAVW